MRWAEAKRNYVITKDFLDPIKWKCGGNCPAPSYKNGDGRMFNMRPSACTPASAWLDPFVAMQTVLEPPAGGWDGLAPAYGFAIVMFGWCALLNGIGITKLRKWNPSGEPIMQRETPDAVDRLADRGLFADRLHLAPDGWWSGRRSPRAGRTRSIHRPTDTP